MQTFDHKNTLIHVAQNIVHKTPKDIFQFSLLERIIPDIWEMKFHLYCITETTSNNKCINQCPIQYIQKHVSNITETFLLLGLKYDYFSEWIIDNYGLYTAVNKCNEQVIIK